MGEHEVALTLLVVRVNDIIDYVDHACVVSGQRMTCSGAVNHACSCLCVCVVVVVCGCVWLCVVVCGYANRSW